MPVPGRASAGTVHVVSSSKAVGAPAWADGARHNRGRWERIRLLVSLVGVLSFTWLLLWTWHGIAGPGLASAQLAVAAAASPSTAPSAATPVPATATGAPTQTPVPARPAPPSAVPSA